MKRLTEVVTFGCLPESYTDAVLNQGTSFTDHVNTTLPRVVLYKDVLVHGLIPSVSLPPTDDRCEALETHHDGRLTNDDYWYIDSSPNADMANE